MHGYALVRTLCLQEHNFSVIVRKYPIIRRFPGSVCHCIQGHHCRNCRNNQKCLLPYCAGCCVRPRAIEPRCKASASYTTVLPQTCHSFNSCKRHNCGYEITARCLKSAFCRHPLIRKIYPYFGTCDGQKQHCMADASQRLVVWGRTLSATQLCYACESAWIPLHLLVVMSNVGRL